MSPPRRVGIPLLLPPKEAMFHHFCDSARGLPPGAVQYQVSAGRYGATGGGIAAIYTAPLPARKLRRLVVRAIDWAVSSFTGLLIVRLPTLTPIRSPAASDSERGIPPAVVPASCRCAAGDSPSAASV